MCPPRGKLGAVSPHFPTGFRVGTSHIGGTAWTQMWAATGRMGVTDRSASSGSWAVLSWVNRAPTREAQAHAPPTSARTPPPLLMIGNVIAGAAVFYGPLVGRHDMLTSSAHILNQGRPPGLPARTGVLNARDPTRTPAWWGLLYARPVVSMFSASVSTRVIDTPSARHSASRTVTVMGAVCPSSARIRISRDRETPDRVESARNDMS
nr:MAG TPA: hypothetical protein [Caudoviricetes sp.]